MSAATDELLRTILAATRYVLLDFDGPICSIYAGRAAPLVAKELAEVILSGGFSVPNEVLGRGDPLEVLRYAGQIGAARVVEDVEIALQEAELAAAETAQATPGVAEFFVACRSTCRPVAVVSNNSAPAVARYLDRAGLAPLLAHIEGRRPNRPELMKPHPVLLQRAIEALGLGVEGAMMVGDSPTDLAAARAAGILSIGFANKPGKAPALATAGAAVVVTRMTDLAHAVTSIS